MITSCVPGFTISFTSDTLAAKLKAIHKVAIHAKLAHAEHHQLAVEIKTQSEYWYLTNSCCIWWKDGYKDGYSCSEQ